MFRSADDTRVYGEHVTGEWFHQQCAELWTKVDVGGTVLGLYLYTDKTSVTVFGNRSLNPMYLAFTNCSREARKMKGGRIIVGFVPFVTNDDIIKHKLPYTGKALLNSWLFHTAVRNIFFNTDLWDGKTYGAIEKSGVYAVDPD